MLPQNRPLLPIFKITAVLASIGIVIFLALNWLLSDREPVPPITEHDFQSGHVSWSIDAYPAKVLRENHFSLDITDLSGAPLQSANLTVKLEMLEMECGDVTFHLIETAPGKYTGEGIPLMAGIWKAAVTIEAEDQTYTIARRLEAVH